MKKIILVLTICFSSVFILAQDWTHRIDQPIELGQVYWLRDYEEAQSLSLIQELPIFILFQEVPGCHTCSTFGNEVMSHPLLVEAIETHFVPLVIYNNKGGSDSKVLKKFKEPSWNNPVVRIVNSYGKDIVTRHAGAYEPLAVLNTIRKAILASHQISPLYLDLLEQEFSVNKEEAVLSMYCFWTGEKEIGSMSGVKYTQAGYMNGTEVVKVKYNPDEISYEELISESSKRKCADKIYTNSKLEKSTAKNNNIPFQNLGAYRIDSQDKYFLSKSEYQSVPMLNIQATKVNSLIAKGQPTLDILSPRQLAILKLSIEGKIKKENRAKNNFLKEWSKMIK